MEIEKDHGDEALRMLKNIALKLEDKVEKLESGKKNSHLHIMIETKAINKLKEEAKVAGVSLAEHCRRKIKWDSQLDRIERKIDKLLG